MKNDDKIEPKDNFTKLIQKRGISLIVLIVTIIVIIILAAAVILTITKNNPVSSAKEATFKEDIRTFQNDLSFSIQSEYVKSGGKRDNKITTSDEKIIKEYIPSITEKYIAKLSIENDVLVYNDSVSSVERDWLEEMGVKAKLKYAAQMIEESPNEYYGKSITNYSANGVDKWKIFYSDGNNVYLISSDYVDVDKLPAKSGTKPSNINADYSKSAILREVAKCYNGSSDIVEPKIKNLNSDYFNKNYSYSGDTLKATSYLLDINIWSIFKDDNGENAKAEYAIGGPTIELLLNSYNKKYNKNYSAYARDGVGYLVNSDVKLDENDNLYSLSNSKDAPGMWISTPNSYYRNSPFQTYYNMFCLVGSSINDGEIYAGSYGFRPIVCLKSGLYLRSVDGGCELFKN